MNILLTGPSCAGKTSLAKQFNAKVTIELDMYTDVCSLPNQHKPCKGQNETVVYEGIVCGPDRAVKDFIKSMDAVFIVTANPIVRFLRCTYRDGYLGVPRWLFNELCWWRFCRPLVLQHEQVRMLIWEPAED